MAEHYHKRSKAHRTLRRGDRGNDVADLQVATGRRLKALSWVNVEAPPTGGEMNTRTIRAVEAVAYALGLPKGHALTPGVQRAIRDPRRRTPAARRRAAARKRQAMKPGFRIIPRSEWGAAPARGSLAIQTVVQKLFVHHTVYPTLPRSATPAQERARMRQIQAGAFAGKYSDVPYNFVQFPSGRVYEGRARGTVGAHTLNNNSTAKGIAFDGNFETSSPTAAALNTARQVRRREAPNRPVEPHSNVYSTACPGRNLRSRLGEISR